MKASFIPLFAFLVNQYNGDCIQARKKMTDLDYNIPITRNCISCVFRNQGYYTALKLEGYDRTCYSQKISEYILKNTTSEEMDSIYNTIFEEGL